LISVAASTAACNSPSAGAPGARHPTRLAVEPGPSARSTGAQPGGGVLAAARLALCKAILLAGQPLRIVIRGSSMAPALWPGESITIHSIEMKDTRVGQIVVFSRDGYFVAHRVVRIDRSADGAGDGAVVTRGDAAGEDDSPVLSSEWLGVVVSVQRFGTARALRFPPSRCARGMAALFRGSDLLRRALDRLSTMLARKASAGSPRGRTVDGFGRTPAEHLVPLAAADGN
jgi:signal peptidase I